MIPATDAAVSAVTLASVTLVTPVNSDSVNAVALVLSG